MQSPTGFSQHQPLRNKVKFPSKYGWVIWAILIYSGSLLIGTGIVKTYDSFKNTKIEQRKYSRLKELTPNEKTILNYYIKYKTRSQRLDYRMFGLGDITPLIKDKIIYITEKHKEKYAVRYTCNMENWAYDYLLDHPDLLK